MAVSVLSLYPTIPPSFSRSVAVNVLSLYPTIPPSFSRSVTDIVPSPHQLAVVITSFICPYVARFVRSVRHVTLLTNKYYSPRTF